MKNFFLLLFLPASLFASESFILKEEVYTSEKSISLSELCQNEVFADFEIPVLISREIDNFEISIYLQNAGIVSPIVSGKSVSVTVLGELSDLEDVSAAILEECEAASNITLPDLPEEFSLQSVQTVQKDDQLAVRIRYIEFDENGIGIPASLDFVSLLDLAPNLGDSYIDDEGILIEDKFYISRIDGDTATLYYRSGGLLIRNLATVIEENSDGSYLLENPDSGLQFTAILEEDE